MIKYTRLFITFLLVVIAFAARSQSTATTSSPYSKYGLGDIDPSLMPQNRAMGGIATATNRINGYNSINIVNPASYGAINLTTIDVGLYSNFITLNQTGQVSQKNSNFRLSHIAFALPITRKSAVSFGLVPYSELGYSYKQSLSHGFGTSSPADTNKVDYLYNGDGGLSKAYIGYGFGIGKHVLIGANISYIFGNLKQYQSLEMPALYGTLNSRVEQSNSVRGLNYDYGIQYTFDLSDTKHLILGYSASANSKINTQNSYIVSQYYNDSNGNQNVPADSLVNKQDSKAKIQLPLINHFGISYQKEGSFIIGADYTMGKWSNLTIAGANAGLRNSNTFNLGGQITPNSNALKNYLALIDYRLGVLYDETYINANGTNIKKYAATFGFGFPLRNDRTTFYKINLSAELGQRGTLVNGLVKENYFNIHLGFMLNDKWFSRYKFD